MISAIPTKYNGTKYRSRTEARWAVFFDRAQLRVRYEGEGYQTDKGWYLPDFEFVETPRKAFFEVKPGKPTDRELALLSALARGAEAHVFVALGQPDIGCVVWKVFADGAHQQWHLGCDMRYLVSFLVDPLDHDRALPLRKDVVPQGLYRLGAMSQLSDAAHFQFPLFDAGPISRHVRDRRDWREREREIVNARTAEARERRLKPRC